MRIHVDTVDGPRIVKADGVRGIQRALDLLFEYDKTIVGNLPALYESGVRYRRERKGGLEDFKGADRCLRELHRGFPNGSGDCDDLAPWRAAELVVSGIDRRARPKAYLARPGLVHVVTMRGDGVPEDPSAVLGMRSKMANGLRYRFGKINNVAECGLSIPVAGERIVVKGRGPNRGAALCDACQRLEDVLCGEVGLCGDASEDGVEVGWVALVVAAAVAIAQALAPRFITAPYDAAEDYPRGIAKAKAITLDESSREAMYASLLLAGWLPVYTSDSVGTRDRIFAEFTRRGWTGGERWGQRYGSAAAQDTGSGKWYYGVHFPLANVPREWAQKAIERAKTFADPAEAIKRTGEFSINAKARMRQYGGDEDFDAMMLDAIPVIQVPAGSVDPAELTASGLEVVGADAGGLLDTMIMMVPGSGVRDVTPGASGPSLSGGGFGGSGGARMDGGGGGAGAGLGAGIAALGELAKLGLPSGSPPSSGSKGPGAWLGALGLGGTGAGKAPASGAGLGADGSGVRGPLTTSQGGLQLQAGPGVERITVPAEPPMISPAAIDKLDRIRELGELVRDGHIERARKVIGRGGPLGRFVRELLR